MGWVLGTSSHTPRLLFPQVLAAGPLNHLGQKLSTWQPVELCLGPACGVGLERPRTPGTPHLPLHQSSSALCRVLRALSIGKKKVLQSKQLLKICALWDKCPCQAKWPSRVYPGDIQGLRCSEFWDGKGRRVRISSVLGQVQCQGCPDHSWP